MKHHFVVCIPEVYSIKYNIPFQFRIGGSPIGPVIMLPRPHTGSLFAFIQVSICLPSGIYQRDIALIRLRLFIQ